ncbi:MAG: HD domain-containing protein [Lachnospiraceae bacterium]|nr:HD domain-containing protein [Lachnospiraceae bacterium]
MVNYLKIISDSEKISDGMKALVSEEMHHGIEVSNLAVKIARELGEKDEFCDRIAIAGVVHDIGKMELTRHLFSKNTDTLVIEHIKYVRFHTEYSYKILMQAGYPEDIAKAVYYHHENYDGSGYPDNLRGDNIPWMARIIRACDVFAALTSDRSYRKAFDTKTAIDIMIDEVADYDMRVFLAFQRIFHRENGFDREMLRNSVNELQSRQLELFIKEAGH